MDTLNQGNKIKFILLIVVFHFMKCNNVIKKSDTQLLKKSKEIISEKVYQEIYNGLEDTLKIWCLNKLPIVLGESMWGYYLDSLICFNISKNRLVSSVLVPCKDSKCVQDEIKFLYGERINNLWYFFRGPSVTVPREMVKDHDISKPLSYQQLHEIALKEVYSGYLNSKGEINEEWFTGQFEGSGWGDFNNQASSDWLLKGKRFKTRKEYFEFVHLQKAKSAWASRDTAKPILQLP